MSWEFSNKIKILFILTGLMTKHRLLVSISTRPVAIYAVLEELIFGACSALQIFLKKFTVKELLCLVNKLPSSVKMMDMSQFNASRCDGRKIRSHSVSVAILNRPFRILSPSGIQDRHEH
jgi:hypothetical protein